MTHGLTGPDSIGPKSLGDPAGMTASAHVRNATGANGPAAPADEELNDATGATGAAPPPMLGHASLTETAKHNRDAVHSASRAGR
jgi:hypothetical protein